MRTNNRIVAIDFFPEAAYRYLNYDAIVCVDIIRATTTLVTSVARGRKTFAAESRAEAQRIASTLTDPIIAGEDETGAPNGYDLPNSPYQVGRRKDIWRPLILVSSYGTKLIANALDCEAVYVASLRNMTATAETLAEEGYERIAILGACSGGQHRCEDQLAAARLGKLLRARGYSPNARNTVTAIQRWSEADTELIRLGRSAESLRLTEQGDDLEYIMSHVDDVDVACATTGAEVHSAGSEVLSQTIVAAPSDPKQPEPDKRARQTSSTDRTADLSSSELSTPERNPTITLRRPMARRHRQAPMPS